MKRPTVLLLLIFAAATIAPACQNEKKKDDDKEEKSSKKKKSGDDDDDDDDKGSKKKKKKKGDDDDEGGGDWTIPKFGEKKCDEYLEKLVNCAKKMSKSNPEAAKAAKKSAEDAVKHWNETVANGVAKSAMHEPCNQALKSVAKAYKTMCPGVFDDDS